jgi:hypothetical protein
MELALTSDERELLMEILEEHHREFLREIARSKHHEFKLALKSKEKLLVSVIEKLRASRPAEMTASSL